MPPSADRSLVWPASTLSEKGQRRCEALDDAVALGLSVGSAPSMNPKTWANEDSVVAHRMPDGSYLVGVADAHWGGASSEAVAQHLLTAFSKSRGASVRDRLHLALRGIDARFQREKADKERSETTVLLAHLTPQGVLDVLSVGDSPFFVLGGQGVVRQMVPAPYRFPLPFVGNCPLSTLPRSVPPEAHTYQLEPGQVALLPTDGIEPDVSGGLTGGESDAMDAKWKASMPKPSPRRAAA